jgi:hypothetical protein
MIESIIGLLTAGLTLWSDKEKHKYIDQLISLKKRYYEEYNKPENVRSDAALDDISFSLRVLGDSFAARIGTSNTPNQ